MVREKFVENENFFKSRNLIFSHVNFKKEMKKKVMEKSGNFKIFQKSC